MTMKTDYTKLTIDELRRLARKNDDNAINEYLRRVENGEYTPKTYTVEELEKIVEKRGYL